MERRNELLRNTAGIFGGEVTYSGTSCQSIVFGTAENAIFEGSQLAPFWDRV